MHSGSVTVRKTRARDAPRLCAIVSILESMPARIGRSVRYAIGKYVSASEKSVAPSPYTENPLTPKTPYVTRPRGPKEKIIAIAAVNGGETSGSSTLASIAVTIRRETLQRDAVKANKKPASVPTMPTRKASSRLFQNARS